MSVAAANDCMGVNDTEGSSAVSIVVSVLPSMASFPVGHFTTRRASGVKEVLSGITSGMIPASETIFATTERGSKCDIVCRVNGRWRVRWALVEESSRLGPFVTHRGFPMTTVAMSRV